MDTMFFVQFIVGIAVVFCVVACLWRAWRNKVFIFIGMMLSIITGLLVLVSLPYSSTWLLSAGFLGAFILLILYFIGGTKQFILGFSGVLKRYHHG